MGAELPTHGCSRFKTAVASYDDRLKKLKRSENELQHEFNLSYEIQA